MMEFGEKAAEMDNLRAQIEATAQLKREIYLLQMLEGAVRRRRVMEPQHSRQDHECQECDALADLDVFRRH